MHLAEAAGPPRHLYPWLAALSRRGELEVAVPAPGRTFQLFSEVGTATVLPYSPLTHPQSLRGMAEATTRLAREIRMFRRHIRRVQPDLVVVVTTVLPAALVAARLERVPAIVYVAEILDGRPVQSPVRRLGTEAIRRLTPRLARALVCCSKTVAAQFENTHNGVVVTTVYPGVGSAYGAGARERFRAVHGIEGAAPCIAVVGNITPGRGQDLVIRALPGLRARLPDVRCLIAGVALERDADLAYRDELTRLAEDLGVAGLVTFAGFVARVADVYAAADVVVNPVRVPEGFGRVAVEALLAGRPVVASRIGAIPEILRDGRDALLVEPDDPGAIAAAVIRLWEDDELRSRLVASGRTRVLAEFDEDESVELFEQVVARVVGH
jgi:glycosyltransferase involved in cell wall biosynthesis